MSKRHQYINLLKRTLPKLGVPVYELPGTAIAPSGCRWPGLWLMPDGVYFIRRYGISPGRLGHEAGHWALCSSEDRAKLAPGCLLDMDIDSLGTDMAAEAWAGAAAHAAGIDMEQMFTDVEDYSLKGVGTAFDSYSLGLTIAIRLIQKTHPGVTILRMMDMSYSYPKMVVWVAGPEQARLWRDFEKEVKQSQMRNLE